MRMLLQYPLLPLLALLTAILAGLGLRLRRAWLLHLAAFCLCAALLLGLALSLPGEALLVLPVPALAVSLLLWKEARP